MRQHILKTILFLSGLFGGLYLYDLWIYHRAASLLPDNQKIGKINRVMTGQMDAQITFWGPSTSWVHFNTPLIQKETGLSCYNMGIDGTFYQQYRGLFQHFLTYTQQAKFIAFAIYPYEFERRTAFRSLHKYKQHYHNPHLYEAFSKTLPFYSWKMHYVPFYKLTAYDPNFYSTVFCPENHKNEDSLGYHPMDLWFHEGEATPPAPVDSALFEDFQKTVLQIKEKGIQPLVVLIPFYIEGQKKMPDFELFCDKVKSLKNEGAIVLDYMHHPISDNKDLFYSLGHLNYRGADSLSLMVSEEIKKLITNNLH